MAATKKHTQKHGTPLLLPYYLHHIMILSFLLSLRCAFLSWKKNCAIMSVKSFVTCRVKSGKVTSVNVFSSSSSRLSKCSYICPLLHTNLFSGNWWARYRWTLSPLILIVTIVVVLWIQIVIHLISYYYLVVCDDLSLIHI